MSMGLALRSWASAGRGANSGAREAMRASATGWDQGDQTGDDGDQALVAFAGPLTPPWRLPPITTRIAVDISFLVDISFRRIWTHMMVASSEEPPMKMLL